MAVPSVFVRAPFNYDYKEASDAAGLVCPPEEDMTQQQFAEEVDINEIVRRFGLTGELPENFRAPMTGDFSEVTDFQSAMNAVRAAESEFMRMPAELRRRFADDPQRLLDFLDDPRNRAEAESLGLVKRPAETTRPAPAAPTTELVSEPLVK